MQLPRDKKYTYADYLTWDDDHRYELIDGVPYMLASPSSDHQEICAELITQLRTYLRGKQCKVFPAPYDVQLKPESEDDTIVQPDISVICDPKKIEKRGCKGAPDMVIEVLSPSTARHDRLIKFNEYRNAGVREYWIINPQERFVDVHLLKNGEYVSQVFSETDTISVHVLEECQINMSDVFPPDIAEPTEDQTPAE